MKPGTEVRYDELPPELVARISATLEPFLTEARKARIDAVLGSRTRDVAVVLEDLANEHNTSAVLRSADAFGFLEVHVLEPRGARFIVTRKITSGAHKWLDLRRHQDAAAAYAHLTARGYHIWAADVRGPTVDLQDIDIHGKVALVFGNEHSGLSPEAAALAHGRFRVPMVGFVESLNVSVAAAVSCYDLYARRRAAGRVGGLPEAEAAALRAVWYAKSVRAGRHLLAQAGLPVPVTGGRLLVVGDDRDEEG